MIKTIIFDLGGVLYNINHFRTRAALAALAADPDSVNLSLEAQADVFSKYEAGKLTSDEFRDSLRASYGMTASDEQIDNAWNAMLGGVIPQSIELIRSLRNRFNVYLLSNINDIHFKAIESECAALFSTFDECYFSYLIGMRKPDREIYEYVLSNTNSLPEQSLFIDDAPQNIRGAQEAGIATYHVTQEYPISKEKLQIALDIDANSKFVVSLRSNVE
ncbi:MAG: HAD family phosphatase [Ignavibacteria bacterium]|nr:HAD family phosphatase [Ignavibacteria bacterium]